MKTDSIIVNTTHELTDDSVIYAADIIDAGGNKKIIITVTGDCIEINDKHFADVVDVVRSIFPHIGKDTKQGYITFEFVEV